MMNVLIAEDDPVSCRIIEATLRKWGYDVVVARDGKEAMKVLKYAEAPRLAILDWMMPGMDGIEICREVRKGPNQPYTYIILLTAKSQKQDMLAGLDAGADDYITKPFDSHELKARLRAGNRIMDLQDELLSMREELENQATHDFLTGLPNRLLFSDRLNQKIVAARRNQGALAVMFLDLDRFKLVNDALGHKIGDLLLQQTADRLVRCPRDVDTVARMGGDEFTIIVSDVKNPTDALRVAERFLDCFSMPFEIEGHQLFVTASLGISIYPAHGSDVETLVRNADSAMYHAKKLGGNRYQPCTDALASMPSTRMQLENSLRRALERDEFMILYQPRVDLKTGNTLGAEALIRWRHPKMGLLYPNQFIPVAEETGLIVPIGQWVLECACKQSKAWQEAGLPPLEMSVNVSARQLEKDNFPDIVRQALEDSGLSPEYLGLELTESILLGNMDVASKKLQELKAMGVKISIDNFGTGHSSLSYLKDLPTDSIKIDPSFVRNIVRVPENAAIAGAVIAMAHSLNLKVVAEGIETLDQLEFLRSLNCDEMQGYFISRPVESAEFVRLFQRERALKTPTRAAA